MAPIPSLATRLLRTSVDLIGPALAGAAARRREQRRGAATVLRAVAPSHPLLPSAVRVERSRHRGGRSGASSDQVAVTLWFREGPALPSPGAGEHTDLARVALRLGVGLARAGAGLAGAAALGAATVAAARIEAARRPERLRAVEAPARLPSGPEADPR
jgi:hypothetical protein